MIHTPGTAFRGAEVGLQGARAGTEGSLSPLVRMRSISRRFGAVQANDSVDLDLRAGEVHALLGENGAGKSTLMHILSGSLRPDQGVIELDGAAVRFPNPRVAITAGIGMVHQHFRLVPTMSVTANIVLNDEPVRGGLVDERAARNEVRQLCTRFGLEVDPEAKIRDVSVAAQQKVEILKVLRRHVRLLILDEPTAVLTPQEVRDLFRFLKGLVEGGTAVVLITHKLSEALGIADRLTILRGGRVVSSRTPQDLTPSELAKLMVGRDVLLEVHKRPATPGQNVLAMRDVRAIDGRGVDALRGLDLELREREILGIAGVDGNGQQELVEVLAGMRAATSGSIEWLGEPIQIRSVDAQLRRGIAYIPEDRQQRGLILDLGVRENLILRRFRDEPFAHRLRLRAEAIEGHAREVIDTFQVRARATDVARNLSGGNQQKLVVGRELSGAPRLLIAAQPTRGVDVGATQFVYDELLAARDAGAAILLVSFDLDELLALSDRLAVIYEGRIVAMFDPRAVDEEQLGLAMTGAHGSAAVA